MNGLHVKDSENRVLIADIADKLEEVFPGIGDESGELDYETIVKRVLEFLEVELEVQKQRLM